MIKILNNNHQSRITGDLAWWSSSDGWEVVGKGVTSSTMEYVIIIIMVTVMITIMVTVMMIIIMVTVMMIIIMVTVMMIIMVTVIITINHGDCDDHHHGDHHPVSV